ncbi:transposase [Patescibacteria group bacterium]|nr:transposase [Patescibacteria group bacterium]MBU2218993.1 transposase [Patescibacteria group bacterium]
MKERPVFISEKLYHIYNRGVEKRKIFANDSDKIRFIHGMFVFNDQSPVIPSNIRFSLRKPSESPCLEVEPLNIARKRKPLVKILAFCLMENHFHFLLMQKVDGGIIKFMQKLGTGYTMYFNQKYQRVGPLFQGRFKATLIENNPQFIHIPYYIHLNPIRLIEPEWQSDKKLKNPKSAIEFLNSYRWSSYLDYIGKNNFPSVISKDFLSKFFENPKQYKNDTEKWLFGG